MDWKKILPKIENKSYSSIIPDRIIMEAVASKKISVVEGTKVSRFNKWLVDDLANLCHFSSESGVPVRKCTYKPNGRRSTQPCAHCQVAYVWEVCYG